MDKPIVLYINHRERSCGVQQFGRKLYDKLALSRNYAIHYIDIDGIEEQNFWIKQLSPEIVVWNYYTNATMPWMSPQIVKSYGIKTACIFHEVGIDHMGFDGVFHQDPTHMSNQSNVFSLARPIPTFNDLLGPPTYRYPVFGSFGFGLGGKGFSRLVEQVGNEYDIATVRLNIPYAAFGDATGEGARSWEVDARRKVKAGITLIVTHDLMPERVLLEWLSHNTANCFLYDENYGRGISGTLDYALAVNRPIVITDSYQFKHITAFNRRVILSEQNTIRNIVSAGTAHLSVFHTMWDDLSVSESFEAGFNTLLGRTA